MTVLKQHECSDRKVNHGLGFLRLLLPLVVLAGLHAQDLTIMAITQNATEPEVTYSQVAANGRIQLSRNDPTSALVVFLDIGNPTSQGMTPNAAVPGVDFTIQVVNAFGVPLATQPTVTAATATAPAFCFVTMPVGNRDLTINLLPLGDDLIEGAEQIIVRPQTSFNYNVSDPGAVTVYITDADQAVRISAVDARGDERVTTASPKAALGAYSTFQVQFDMTSPNGDANDLDHPGAAGYPIDRILTLDRDQSVGSATPGVDFGLISMPQPPTPTFVDTLYLGQGCVMINPTRS